ncbi:MAG: ABC transporter ATP-binding protein [Chloroflexota bacterium]
MTFIRLQNVSKNYGQTQAVIDLDLTIPKSAITVLLGRSGCGKTTTLRIVAGLEKPDSGDVWIGEQQVSGGQVWMSATQRQIGMVFQDYALFPHLTVAKNIGFGIPNQSSADRNNRIAALLDLVGLTGMEERYPHQLSGGQQQRVALARALAPSPDVILLDEPFSNLDASLRQTMREEVRNILHEAQVTTIFVTHDQEEALRLADELVIMDGGRVLQNGVPEDIYRYPTSLKVAQFLAKVNVLTGEAKQGHVETSLGNLPLYDPELVGAVDVVLFPEAISLSHDSQGSTLVEDVSYFGFHQLVTLRLENGETLQARTWSHANITTGDSVRAIVDAPVVAFAKGNDQAPSL